MSETKVMPVPDGLDGERVDAALARLLGLSRSKVATLAADGGVRVNGVEVGKSERLVAGSMLEVDMPEPARAPQVIAEPIAGMEILFEDDDIVVVDKPVGVAAHPGVGWTGPTVIGGLAGAGVRISTSGIHERQGIVHRLDVGTSGIMAVAKSELAYSRMKQAFRDRAVHKVYHALVQGYPDPLTGTIDAPIGRHPTADWRWGVRKDGKHSITHYRTLEAFRVATLLEVHLETGRTHQIRVHMQAIRHPCVGDTTYGADPTLAVRLGLERQWLHAVELAFAHPRSGEQVHLTSQYPADLQHALDLLTGA